MARRIAEAVLSWICFSCGKSNSPFRGYCKSCGLNKNPRKGYE